MSVRSLLTATATAGALVVIGVAPAAAITTSPEPSSAANGRIENAVQVGGDLYIGGSFTAVDGTEHTRLAALDTYTGILDNSFDVDVNGAVTSLAASGTTLYIAGQFTAVGLAARKNVAAINTATVAATMKTTPRGSLAMT